MYHASWGKIAELKQGVATADGRVAVTWSTSLGTQGIPSLRRCCHNTLLEHRQDALVFLDILRPHCQGHFEALEDCTRSVAAVCVALRTHCWN